MVDGHQLADDRHDPVGKAPVVVGHVREVLNLADDVVTQVANEPTVERGQSFDVRRPEAGQEVLQSHQEAVIGPDAVRQVTVDLQRTPCRGQGGRRIPTDERPTSPGLPTVHALQQEALAVAHTAGKQ